MTARVVFQNDITRLLMQGGTWCMCATLVGA